MTQGGVLPSQDIKELIRQGAIKSREPLTATQVQPASLDLRLGPVAHRMQASFLPGQKASVRNKLEALAMTTLDLTKPAVLETGCVYLVELLEELRLPADTTAKANPKSTTGRLDIFTRLVTDRSSAFEHVQAGYEGPLYAEIIPRTFPVIVQKGTALSQIRLIRGDPTLDDAELKALDNLAPLTSRNGKVQSADIQNGIRLRISLQPERGDKAIGYRGAHNARIVDLDARQAPNGYWERITECPNGQLILNPGDFYILGSEDQVRIPPEHAAEMVPFDPAVGEIRVHYAGFFDPGFGWNEDQGRGTRAVLEVRAHETPFALEHGQVVATLEYSRMLAQPTELYGKSIGSAYHSQGLALSKQFTKWAE